MTRSPTYLTWVGMKQRCDNPEATSFPNYGALGVTYCDRWFSFENFLEDMGERPPGHTLDRIDCAGDYSPENCRWADHKTQQRNRRSSRIIRFAGKEQCLAAWAEDLGTSPSALFHRLNKAGWSIERALTTPIRGYRSVAQ